MKTLSLSFAQEQQVQHTIAILQKMYHVSIFEINEAAIRECVARGHTPNQIVTNMFRFTKES